MFFSLSLARALFSPPNEKRLQDDIWCIINAIIQQLSNRLASLSFSLSRLFVRVLYFFLLLLLAVVIEGYPVTKTGCCCCNHTRIHGSCNANSKKEEEKCERKEREKEKTATYSTRELWRAQQALPCKGKRMGHWHYITATKKRTRSSEEEEGGEMHRDPFVPRGQNKRQSMMLSE